MLSLLRPVFALKLLPSSGLDNRADAALLLSLGDLVLNVLMPMAALVAFCLLSFGLVGQALQQRCVPEDITSATVQADARFAAYGEEYFYSEYNTLFCGEK